MDAGAVGRGHSAAFLDLKSALFSYRKRENHLLVGLEYSILNTYPSAQNLQDY